MISKAALSECRLDPNLPLVVGVSGGPDSLCLAHALHQLNYHIIIAHFDHHLRPESPQEAEKVQNWSRNHELTSFIGEEDVRTLAKLQRLSIEETARIARYQFLFSVARQQQAQAVAVAHNADDQVETVLMHLLRGAGLSGLKGMLPYSLIEGWDPSIPLIRPLLSVWRRDIEAYCLAENLNPSLDESNQDPTFFRNRLRHQLLPHLESYNPQVRSLIWRTSCSLAGDAEIIETAILSAWQDCLLDCGPGYISLDYDHLHSQPVGLQRGLLRKAFAGLRPGIRNLDFEVIERAIQFLAQPTRSGELDLALGLHFFYEPPSLFLAENTASLPNHTDWPQVKHELFLNIPDQIDLGNGWIIESDQGFLIDSTHLKQDNPWETILDANNLTLPLRVGKTVPGLRYRPFGMQGKSQKLSDCFVNLSLPRRARANWPLIFSGETIAWIPGLHAAEDFRIQPNTVNTVRLKAYHV